VGVKFINLVKHLHVRPPVVSQLDFTLTREITKLEIPLFGLGNGYLKGCLYHRISILHVHTVYSGSVKILPILKTDPRPGVRIVLKIRDDRPDRPVTAPGRWPLSATLQNNARRRYTVCSRCACVHVPVVVVRIPFNVISIIII